MRVPLLIKYPRGEAGVVDDPVALVDVFPTVLDVLGLPRRPELVGRSLKDGTDPDRIVYSETSRKRTLRAAIGQGRKLIRDLETDALELYDLRADAGEHSDRFEPDTPDPLRGALDDFVATLRTQAGVGEERELSEAEQADLRALGYGGEE